MPRTFTDQYTNLASSEVTESAAGTLTLVELLTGISLGGGIGMLIDQIDYQFSAAALELVVAASDSLSAGWFTSNAPTAFDLNDRRQIHQMSVSQALVGAVVSQTHFIQPFTFSFSPAMIFANPRLYLAIRGLNLAAVGFVVSRIYFRYIPLTPQQYLELAEAFILVG